MNEPRALRVVCLDDGEETRLLFRLLMNGKTDLEAVSCLSNARELVGCIEKTSPDVVIVDMWMPGQEPMEAMREAKDRFPAVSFLVLSSDDNLSSIDLAFASGASGYTIKDGHFDRLVAAIRAVASGEIVRPQGGARHGLL